MDPSNPFNGSDPWKGLGTSHPWEGLGTSHPWEGLGTSRPLRWVWAETGRTGWALRHVGSVTLSIWSVRGWGPSGTDLSHSILREAARRAGDPAAWRSDQARSSPVLLLRAARPSPIYCGLKDALLVPPNHTLAALSRWCRDRGCHHC